MTKKSLIVSGVCLTALLICVGCASTGTYTDSQGNPIPAGAAKAYNSGNASFKLGKYQ